jgi:hypothetical protein
MRFANAGLRSLNAQVPIMNKASGACLLALALMLLSAGPARAVVFTLSGPTPESSGMDLNATGALYASTRDGGVVLIARVGAIAPDGGEFTELGVPSISPEGSVVFGAETRGIDDRPVWDIYRADPSGAGDNRLSRVFDGAIITDQCRPAFKVDPYPVAGTGGAIAFVSPEVSGPDALFRYRGGRLDCLARIGDRTALGNRIAMFNFGSLAIADDGALAFLVHLKGASASKSVRGIASNRSAVMIADQHSMMREVALEGDLAPGGSRFTWMFSRPAIVQSRSGAMVAFSNRSRTGVGVYLRRGKHLARGLITGVPTELGALTYISDGKPALMEDGTMIVRGASGALSAVFSVKDRKVAVVTQEGTFRHSGAQLVNFGDPSVTSSGAIILGGYDQTGRGRLFVFDREDAEAAMHPMTETTMIPDAMPPVFPGTIAVNGRGDFAFLGTPMTRDPLASRVLIRDTFGGL